MAASIRLQRAVKLGNVLLRREAYVLRTKGHRTFILRSQHKGLWSSFRALSAQAAPESDHHNIIKNTEKATGDGDKHEFQAETRMLLDIVAKSLYSDKEKPRRCTRCPRNRDMKTKSYCTFCLDVMCVRHMKNICENCAEKNFWTWPLMFYGKALLVYFVKKYVLLILIVVFFFTYEFLTYMNFVYTKSTISGRKKIVRILLLLSKTKNLNEKKNVHKLKQEAEVARKKTDITKCEICPRH
ncbi:Heat shock protein 75 kDa, mitochondrial [Gryllus bimaculatus]|nr:Heat shock protein 75 kDa, mitochondrial [Gryllus bimaculatus]